MKRIYLILTGISLILLSSCAQRAREAKGHQTVKIDTVVSADKQTFLQFPGKVKAAQDISLAFRVSGTISKIHVKDGARVQEGQLLAELDPTDYQVQLDATEAEYQQIKAEAERVMALYKDNGTTPNANDKAVYGLKQITAKYKHHKDQLALHPALCSFQRVCPETPVRSSRNHRSRNARHCHDQRRNPRSGNKSACGRIYPPGAVRQLSLHI